MKRRIGFVLAALLFALLLCGCQILCRHDYRAATCEEPEICTRCEKTQGESLGHLWEKATCETPKICTRCKATRGMEKGHRWEMATCTQPKFCPVCHKTEGTPAEHSWEEATCEKPKTCTLCAIAEGEPLAHQWQPATTEAPKTCALCQKTQGLPLHVDDPRFTTEQTQALHGTWKTAISVSGDLFGEPDFTQSLKGEVYLTFGSTGMLSIRLEPENMEEFEKAMFQYAKERVYGEFAAKGIGQSAADLLIRAKFGKTTDEYVAQLIEEIDVPGMMAELTKPRVYYAQGNTVYIADNWNGSFMESSYRFVGEKLIFSQVYLNDPANPLQWTRVTE